MSRLYTSVLAVASCLVSTSVSAATAQEDASAFGRRPDVLSVSLSPSGEKIAFVAPLEGGFEKVTLVDMRSPTPKTILALRQKDAELEGCSWATEEKLICYVSYVGTDGADLVGYSRTFVIDSATGESRMLSDRGSSGALQVSQSGGSVIALDPPGEPGKVMMTRQWVPERTTGTRMARDQTGVGVDLVDLQTAHRSSIEGPDPLAERYIVDDAGQLRIKVRHLRDSNGRLTGKRDFMFREPGSKTWKLLSRSASIDGALDGFYPVAVDSKRNVAFGYLTRDGFDTVQTMPLAEGATSEQVAGRNDADIDSLITIGRNRRVVGASFATEKREEIYFDKELQALSRQLRAALANKPLVSVVDSNADETKLLLIASSDTDPGMLYLYDKPGRKLEEVVPMRGALAKRAMAQMKPVSFPAADGTAIPGYLTLPVGSSGKGLPAIVLPHGGPSARDEWGFDWLVQFFAARGYAVLQPNYRGSSGYGSAWFGKNGFKAWRTAVGDVNDAGRWLVSQGIANPSNLAIVGWSYGGYAALQSQVVDPQLYKAVVAIAPVTDLSMTKSEAANFTNSQLVEKFVGNGPHVAEGSPAQNVERIAAPVLMFHGDRDENVRITQSRYMKRRLEDAGKPVELVEFPGLAHSLDDSTARSDMLARIDAFLAKSLGR